MLQRKQSAEELWQMEIHDLNEVLWVHEDDAVPTLLFLNESFVLTLRYWKKTNIIRYIWLFQKRITAIFLLVYDYLEIFCYLISKFCS